MPKQQVFYLMHMKAYTNIFSIPISHFIYLTLPNIYIEYSPNLYISFYKRVFKVTKAL